MDDDDNDDDDCGGEFFSHLSHADVSHVRFYELNR